MFVVFLANLYSSSPSCVSVVLDRSTLSVPGCGGLISLQVGGNHSSEIFTLTSPGYPEGYADMLNCEWIFETAPGNHLGLVFQNMDIEQSDSCFLDYVQVYTGKRHAEPFAVTLV